MIPGTKRNCVEGRKKRRGKNVPAVLLLGRTGRAYRKNPVETIHPRDPSATLTLKTLVGPSLSVS